MQPLLDKDWLPDFDAIVPEQVPDALSQHLDESRAAIAQLLTQAEYSWESLILPLEAISDKLGKFWSPISHLNLVMNSDALREAYNRCLPLLSAYYTELGQNQALCAAYQQLQDSDAFAQLSQEQQQTVIQALRDFRLSGVDLAEDKKQRYAEIKSRLATLTSQFGDNVLDATNAWHLDINDEQRLQGLPEDAISQAKQKAEAEGQAGWRFSLDFPVYYAVVTYADDRALRETFYRAYCTRASDQGEQSQWDNSPIMEEILALRHELAQLLGFANYAECSLATKMAEDTPQVLNFLSDLAAKSLPTAKGELQALKDFAAEQGQPELAAWDISYYSERLKQREHAINQEQLRPYFPMSRVLQGMFAVVERLFAIHVYPREDVTAWHPDVSFFEIQDQSGKLRGGFYLDPYARSKKRGGAWMDDYCGRRQLAPGQHQIPIAYLTCNFNPPSEGKPALLTHDEVTTLFHEFGHGLHHMLTQVTAADVAGINGVAWDAVELPSQFLENWCWEREAVDLMSAHYESQAPLPEAMFTALSAAKHFQSAMQMLRQVEFSLFDFRLHAEYDPAQGGRVQAVLDEVRDQVAVLIPPEFNRFQHGFSHIFAGGYAAGYYSYKWAEVLSADAFSLFEERGIFDPTTGQSFLETILERGGSELPMTLFVRFRGRRPQVDALLRHSGLAA